MSLPKEFSPIGKMIVMQSMQNADIRLLTLGFRFKDSQTDPWTLRFRAFKDREPGAVRAAARTLVSALGSVNWKTSRRVILGAISSHATRLEKSSPVYALCEAIHRDLRWEWPQEILSKRTHQSLHLSAGNRAYRDAIVKGVYSCEPLPRELPRGILMIVDDLATNGSTAKDIWRAFSEANSGWGVRCITLGKNESLGYWHGKGVQITNDHINKNLDEVWG